jgi:predicted nucleic acid-binding protein
LTENFFAQLHNFEVYISDLTLDEIAKNKNESFKEKMHGCVVPFTVLWKTDKVIILAKELVQNHAVPQQSEADAYHIAIAVVSRMDYLLSWNFKHLVRLKTKEVVRQLTILHGYHPLEIIAPPELI